MPIAVIKLAKQDKEFKIKVNRAKADDQTREVVLFDEGDNIVRTFQADEVEYWYVTGD